MGISISHLDPSQAQTSPPQLQETLKTVRSNIAGMSFTQSTSHTRLTPKRSKITHPKEQKLKMIGFAQMPLSVSPLPSVSNSSDSQKRGITYRTDQKVTLAPGAVCL